jgi:hypothetical protein
VAEVSKDEVQGLELMKAQDDPVVDEGKDEEIDV